MSKKKLLSKTAVRLSSIANEGEEFIAGTFVRICRVRFNLSEVQAVEVLGTAIDHGAVKFSRFGGDGSTMLYVMLKHETIEV